MGTLSSDAAHLSNDLALPGVLVKPSWLADQLDNGKLRVLDVRQPEHYVRGHIAGALNAPLESFICTLDGVDGMLLPSTEYAALMSRLGIFEDAVVVVYDDTWGMAAARLFWSLEYYGHRKVAVLDGGWDIWRAQNLPVDVRSPNVAPSHFTSQPDDDRLATYTWLTERLDHSHSISARPVVVDTRSPAEYARGHLPGALSWDWINATSPGSWEAMRDANELRTELHEIGVTPDKEIVVYCRSGVRAAHTYLVLRQLGYTRVRNYDGSWLEWEVRTPVSNAPEEARPAWEEST